MSRFSSRVTNREDLVESKKKCNHSHLTTYQSQGKGMGTFSPISFEWSLAASSTMVTNTYESYLYDSVSEIIRTLTLKIRASFAVNPS